MTGEGVATGAIGATGGSTGGAGAGVSTGGWGVGVGEGFGSAPWMALTAELAFKRPPVTDLPASPGLAVDRGEQRVAQEGRRRARLQRERERGGAGDMGEAIEVPSRYA